MKLTIQTKDNNFYLTTDKSISSIFIKKEKIAYFKKNQQTFVISAKQILEILTPSMEDRAKIFYTTVSDDTPKEFYLDDQLSLQIEGPLNLNYKEEVVALYVTLDSYLRFISNQPPSAQSYFDSSSIKAINTIKDDNKVRLEIQIISKHLEIDEAIFYLKNRKSQVSLKSSTISKKCSFKNSLFYTEFIYDIFLSDILTILDHSNYNNFDATVLDTFISPIFKFSKTTLRQFKIERPVSFEEENWLTHNEHKLLLKNYGTDKFNNLAFRTSFLDVSAYNYYINLKKQVFFKKDSPRKTVLISEYPHKAQDNGLILFNYLNKEHSELLDCYYVLTEDSQDIKNINNFRDKVIPYKSEKHFEIILKTNLILHTHSSNYALPLMTSFMETYYKDIKKIFLQHGIIGERDLSYLYGKKLNPTFTNKFIVSSSREKKIVKKELGYNTEDIWETGLARFDSLIEGNSPEISHKLRNKILIMPSWRQGQDNLNDSDFRKTDFYIEFSSLLSDSDFKNLAQRYSLDITFYLHTNFQKYRHLFQSDFITILPEGEETVQSLLKSHGILITDFSSVGLDFSLLDRSVLYYQFDKKLTESRKKKKNFLPGPIINRRKKLLETLEKKIKNNSLSLRYKLLRKKNIYTYDDTSAMKRIADEIIKLLKNKKSD